MSFNFLRFLSIPLIFIYCLLSPILASTREVLKIDSETELSILANKAYGKGKGDTMRLAGNVIITLGQETLYGEVGQVDVKQRVITMNGNVRFTTPDLSIYGSTLIYYLENGLLIVDNVRVISKSFSLHGRQIKRQPGNIIVAKNAEYSTCQDCPQSWSVYGGSVTITLGEYVTIKDAVVKITGVPMAYLPYFIFPIKVKRGTGFLMAQMYRSSINEGVTFKQPFFWAIDPSQDMTLTPSIFGERGWGGEAEYRSVLGDDKWLNINGLNIFDELYNPDYVNGDNSEIGYNRYFAHYEHNFRLGNEFNHHFSFNDVRERDIIRDFERETKGFFYGNELGQEGFFEWKNDFGQISTSGHFVDNLISDDPQTFDHHTVQVLPRLSLSATPINLFNTDDMPLFNSATIGFQSDVTNFKQNRSTDADGFRRDDPTARAASKTRRNALRYNMKPFIDVMVANWGAFKLNTSVDWDYQFYQLPEIAGEGVETQKRDHFSKGVVLTQHEFSFELGRTYGLAYQVNIPSSKVKVDIQEEKKKKEEKDSNVIGSLPPFREDLVEDWVLLKSQSYRHTQEWKLIHSHFLDSHSSGNADFSKQLRSEEGFFDIIDAYRENETDTSFLQSPGELLQDNVIELQWNNSVVR